MSDSDNGHASTMTKTIQSLLAFLLLVCTYDAHGQAERCRIKLYGFSMDSSPFIAVTADNIAQRSDISVDVRNPIKFINKFNRMIEYQKLIPPSKDCYESIRILYKISCNKNQSDIAVSIRYKCVIYNNKCYIPDKKLIKLLMESIPKKLRNEYMP